MTYIALLIIVFPISDVLEVIFSSWIFLVRILVRIFFLKIKSLKKKKKKFMIYSSIPGHIFHMLPCLWPPSPPLAPWAGSPCHSAHSWRRCADPCALSCLRCAPANTNLWVKLYGDGSRKNKLSNLVQRMKTT